MKKTLAASAMTVGLLAAPLAGTALADPDGNQVLNGSGSDTTEVVMRNLDTQITKLGSWDISGGAWDTNGAAAGCSFVGRVAGSGAGRTALANSVTLADGCFQFARSSSRSVSQAPGTVAIGPGDGSAGNYVASGSAVAMLPLTLGVDGLSYVYRSLSGTPRDLTLGQLRAIYHCTFTGTVDLRNMASSSIPNQPLLPTDASGSRADWLKLMQNPGDTADYTAGSGEVASDGGTLPSCIDDGPGDTGIPGGEFSEHNGNVLTNGRQIILHSVAQWIAQGKSATGDFHGLAQLGYINGNVPLQQFDHAGGVLDPSTASGSAIVDGAYFRNVYNIIPASQVSNSDVVSVFGTRTGGSSASGSDLPVAEAGTLGQSICTNDDIVINTGFIPVC
ncbi:MAG: hypothetical protein M3P04_14500 [Actinomycetota bacterium]|nr:hypothetical protein [Actinomycetota bacterium]